MTVRDYRVSLGWSVSELARRAGLTSKTISRIEDGEPVFDHSVGAVAKALSEALGQTITIYDLDGVNIVNK